ncbi:glutathione S-transferase N-terminal domain-containing protein [Hoeflea sp. G2-23]|uniref:Glutathione S-transferase N-terminal domain-containing protein n=1 Tax=Hoeflea algicola TaxID=2983763 RepID=A0ABT3Z9N3_9HYPH|nr:glutathione S-transferase N-terminal domain-containing protein [Hoeflea algicola]MCY0148497.1 glutathione S-transferase N-terminal domain-containing protein [Hoeflea algicola]
MKLFYSPASPFVRKISVLAIELDLVARIERIPVDVWEPETPYVGINPLGKVPAFVTDDGSVIYDSPVICEYLNSLAAGHLFPAPGAGRWTVLCNQALADGVCDAAVLRLHESRRDDSKRSDEWIARQRGVIARSLDLLEHNETRLEGDIDIGKISVGVMLGYLDFRFGGDQWRNGRPALSRWYETFSARESMTATLPPHLRR